MAWRGHGVGRRGGGQCGAIADAGRLADISDDQRHKSLLSRRSEGQDMRSGWMVVLEER
jgi:hypothetical protein